MGNGWKGIKLPWNTDLDDEHYQAAYDFLSLQWVPDLADDVVKQLRAAPISKQNPGDLLRAAGLDPLPLTNNGVMQEVRKAIVDGHLHAVLCVNLPEGIIIADGYHRLSAAVALSPFHKAPLKLAGAEKPITPPER